MEKSVPVISRFPLFFLFALVLMVIGTGYGTCNFPIRVIHTSLPQAGLTGSLIFLVSRAGFAPVWKRVLFCIPTSFGISWLGGRRWECKPVEKEVPGNMTLPGFLKLAEIFRPVFYIGIIRI